MKVLHVVPSLPQASGITTFIVECTEALREAGLEQTIATQAESAEMLARIGEFDIVHLHGIWPRLFHRFAAAARRHRIPIVWSIHGMLSPWAMKYKWWKKIPAWWLWQRRDLKSAAVLHVTSEREIEWVRAQGLKNQIVNIPLGTKLPEDIPTRAHATKRLLFVGRICSIKALDNLIRAWDLVRPANWTLRIVGNDEQDYQAKLVQLADELKLDASVEFPGSKFGKDLEEEYRNADALVLPSHTENFGAVVADALAWGIPVITSKGTPWREVGVESGSGSGREVGVESGSGRVEFVNLEPGDTFDQVEAVEINQDVKFRSTPRGAISKDLNSAPILNLTSQLAERIAYYVGDVNRTHPAFLGCSELFSIERAAELIRENVGEEGCEVAGLRGRWVASRENRSTDESNNPKSNNPTIQQSNNSSCCGWWVENDPENLAKALRELVSLSDEERAEMGKRGRELVEERYAWKAVGKTMLEEYRKIIVGLLDCLIVGLFDCWIV